MDADTIRGVASAAALLALAAAAMVVVLHVVPTDVDPLIDGVSAYALTRSGTLYRIQVVVTGLAALLLTLVLLVGGLASGVAVALLAVFGVSRILIAHYPTDRRGTTSFSRTGRLHVLLAATTFVTIAVAAPAIGGTLTNSPGWTGWAAGLAVLGWATTACSFATFASSTTPMTRRFFGLVERGAYAGMLGWLAIAAAGVNAAA